MPDQISTDSPMPDTSGYTLLSPVVALHCSGASWRQWEALQEMFCDGAPVILPQFSGPEVLKKGFADRIFTLADEAAPIISELQRLGRPAHLVGHSYGGGVALHIARNHPDLVESLCLYEPTAFNLLKFSHPADQTLAREIETLSNSIQTALSEEADLYAAQAFTDFWGGLGALQALSDRKRTAMLDWIAKAPLDFRALLQEPAGRTLRSDLHVTLIMGQYTQPQTRRITELLVEEITGAVVHEIAGANHLGPFIFHDRVMALVADHIRKAELIFELRYL